MSGDRKKGKKPAQPGSQGPTGPQGCGAKSCTNKEKRFGFCQEHYDHFKFGLIKRTGEKVSDYEKKLEHFAAYKERLAAKQVA